MLILNVNCIFCSYNKQCECCRMFMFSAHAFTFIFGIKQKYFLKNILTAENISTCGRCSMAAVSAIAPYNIEK